MAGVERYGIEPSPPRERTVGWRDLFAINFTFFLNPVMMVLGALAVRPGGLPLAWAVVATVVGQALAYARSRSSASLGSTTACRGRWRCGPPSGCWGARLLTSPYRVIAASYWFAAQALAGGVRDPGHDRRA